ncbi:hypothetical protein GIB67_004468 [Kingdonia uniflora]|uniref:Uncharacterized protein n=1 Tax=Kingdonia uniflora TaxID=39325 RepID=A0A7J7LS10_9MAGN|nr:hypothetical protein GIB67_039673 [Kingdonia uniflora]KAF6157530.1 hypothetical protein GIB67_004468 [Kingdonia uniflora]
MLPSAKLSYQRLRNEVEFEGEHEQRLVGRTRSWSRITTRVTSKRRPKVRIPGLRKFLRRKAKLFSFVKVSMGKVLQRLKESRSHMGEIFAGNYLFVQVSPSLKCPGHNKKYISYGLHDLNSRYSVGRVAQR